MAEIHPELLEVLQKASLPLEGDDGNPLGAGTLFEIFIGLKPLPASFDWFIEDDEAIELSEALAEHLCGGRTWRNCRDEVMAAYPISKLSRRERFAEVMAGVKDYSAEDLDGELLDLNATHIALGGNPKQGANQFLNSLRKCAEKMKDQKSH